MNVQRGTYRGVGVGQRPARVEIALGRHARFDANAGIAPVGSSLDEIGGPPVITPPRRDEASSASERLLRYRGVSFLARNNAVYAVLVTAAGARTKEGIGIGSDLADVKHRYPMAACDTQTDEDGAPDYPYCEAQLAPGRFVLFSKDPIRSIAMATRQMH